jgi:hypothetical protein
VNRREAISLQPGNTIGAKLWPQRATEKQRTAERILIKQFSAALLYSVAILKQPTPHYLHDEVFFLVY